ncbi:Glutaredoxin-1 [Intoshia linei]|uniref:Glutaredoxin-1 n=1 Tax=Intoshia linei TaxID=1819745 RepID=A0A177AX58_9BILA|nr:Glutaredoxin-1 [Intoshia linei]
MSEIIAKYLSNYKKVVLIGKSFCPFCVKTEKLFNDLIKKNILERSDFHVYYLDLIFKDNKKTISDIQDYLLSQNGIRTVPQIYINKKFIGDCSEIHNLHKNNELISLF